MPPPGYAKTPLIKKLNSQTTAKTAVGENVIGEIVLPTGGM